MTGNGWSTASKDPPPRALLQGRLHEAFAEATLESLKPATLALALLFALFAGAHLLVLPQGAARQMAVLAGGTSALLLGLAVALARGRVAARQAPAVAALLVALALANSTAHLLLTGDARQTTNFALVLIAASLLLLSTRWFLALATATILAWGVSAVAAPASREWLHYAFLLASSALLSGLVFLTRRRTYREIVERSLAEERLREDLTRAAREAEEREAHYRALVANIPGAVYQSDVGSPWRMHFVSESVHPITGYPAAEFTERGRTWESLIHPDDVERGAEAVRRAVEGREAFQIEYRILRRDGSTAWVWERGRARYDATGEPTQLDGVIFDITEERHAEDALRRREAQLALAQQMATLGSWEWDVARDEAAWSPELYRVLGVPEGEQPPRLAGFLDLLHPDDRERVAEAAQAALAAREPFRVEARLAHRADEHGPRIIALRAEVVGDARGGPLRVVGIVQDVTEHHRAAQTLARILREQEAIMTAVPDVIYMLDAEGRLVRWNHAVERITGKAPADLAGMSALDFFVPEDAPQVAAAVERTLREGYGELEARILLAGGGTAAYEFRSVSIRAADGTLLGLAGSGRDVTEKRRAEETLRKATEQLKDAQRLAHVGSWDLDLATRHVEWSDEMYRIYGVSPVGAPVESDQLLEAVHPDDRDAVAAAVRSAIDEGAPLGIEYRIRLPDGTERSIHSEGHVRHDETGKARRLVGTSQDVTALRAAEAEVRRSRSTLKEYVDALTTLNAMLSREGKVILVGESSAKFVGARGDDLVGAPFLDAPWFTYDPAIHAAIRQHFANALSGTREAFDIPIRLPGGRLADTRASFTPVPDKEGGVKYVIAEAIDVTPLREAEEALRKQRDRLERLSQDLRRANEELEAFSYSVSHDLKAPLRGIDYLSLAILEDYGGRLDPEGRLQLERLRAEVRRMADLIEDLLKLSRSTRGTLRRERVDLSELAAEVIDEIRRREPQRRVDVQIETGAFADADPRLVRVVLENILGNAWKYTRRTDHPRIRFGVRRHGGEEDFYVSDNGAGFDMAKAGRLFQPFQRLHTRSEFEGTGIGLAIVQRIIDRHGGRIWAEAEPGKGATFFFTLGGAGGRSLGE